MKYLNKPYAKILLLVSSFLASNIIFGQELISKTATIRAFEQELREKAKADGFIKIGNLPNFIEDAKPPIGTKGWFQEIEITSPTFGEGHELFEDGFSISGTAQFKGESLAAQLYVVLKNDVKHHILRLNFQLEKKLSKIFGDLSGFEDLDKLDFLELPSASLVLTDVEYLDEEFGRVETGGVNFFSDLGALTGPLKPIEKLINELKKHAGKLGDSFVFEGAESKFAAIIKEKLYNSRLKAFIPLRVGFDFTKIVKDPKVITYITTGDYYVDFSISYGPQPTLKATLSAALLLGLASQSEPLEFRMEGAFTAKKASLSGFMTGMWDPAFGLKWLALGEMGLQVDFDYKLLPEFAAVGIPFTGLGVRGKTYLGDERDPEKRREIAIAGLVSLSLSELSDIAFVGHAQELSLSDLIAFLAKIVGAKLSFDIPVMELSNVDLYYVLYPTTIVGKDYPPGITFDAEATIANLGGRLYASLKVDELKIAGMGRLNNIEKRFFKLTGPGPDDKYGTEDDGPIIDLLLDGFEPKKSHFTLDGQVEIPPLGFKQSARLSINKSKIEGSFDVKLANLFQVDMDLSFPFTNPEHFFAKFDLQQDFADFFRDDVMQDLTDLFDDIKQNTSTAIDQLNQEISEAQSEFDRLANAEIDRVNKRIGELDREISALDREISALDTEVENSRKICWKVGLVDGGLEKRKAECKKWGEKKLVRGEKKLVRGARKLERAGLITYREAILKPGVKLTGAVLDVADRLADLKVAKKAQEKILDLTLSVIDKLFERLFIIDIQKVSAQVDGKDLLEGKSPKLNELLIVFSLDTTIFGKRVAFAESLHLTDIQFDFKKPGKYIKPIAKKIFDRVKSQIRSKVGVKF